MGYVEREAFPAAVLVARMEEQALDQAPIWDDLATFPGHLYSGRVDLISAGFPCQPFSAAGKRQGKADDRWLWPLIADTIQQVRPGRVFLENVPGVIRHGLPDILRDLAEMGFDAEWGLFRADTHAGAPHRRQRFFLLADCDSLHDHGSGQTGQAGRYESPDRSHPVAEYPPGPSDVDGWRHYEGPQPAVCRGADGAAYRVDRLRALGNAAVPQCVAVAYRELDRRLTL